MQTLTELKRIRLSLNGLVFYEDILRDKRLSSYRRLLDSVIAPCLNGEEIYKHYQEFYKSMLGLNWVQYVVELLLQSDNRYAALAAKDPQEISSYILENVAGDLNIIQDFIQITPESIISIIKHRFDNELTKEEKDVFAGRLLPDKWPVWDGSFPKGLTNEDFDITSLPGAQWIKAIRKRFRDRFISEKKWEQNVPLLTEYHQTVGYGKYSRYAAFTVQETDKGLQGIENPDPIQLKNLICQKREQNVVLRNTEGFLQGFPANNIILYGNRGTGKSSLVKALLNEYAPKGLRLVQLKKSKIEIFPELVSVLATIPLKFIIFIDDLSFNDEEDDYKNLKSLLEGGVESRPANVLVYATSNRKHLVRESFVERRADDVHANDNMEEKLSLADRFGITVTFLSPDQETFLKIVEGLAEQSKITMDNNELRKRALKWVMMHNGRSGRTARQFVDSLIAEIGLNNLS